MSEQGVGTLKPLGALHCSGSVFENFDIGIFTFSIYAISSAFCTPSDGYKAESIRETA